VYNCISAVSLIRLFANFSQCRIPPTSTLRSSLLMLHTTLSATTQLALQPCAQAPWAAWSHLCWKGYPPPQEQALKESHLEEEPDCHPPPLPLSLCALLFCLCGISVLCRPLIVFVWASQILLPSFWDSLSFVELFAICLFYWMMKRFSNLMLGAVVATIWCWFVLSIYLC
jgi:hypothetical protein